MARLRQVVAQVVALAASGIVAACAATYVVAPPPLVPAEAQAPVAVLDHGRHSSLVIGLPDGRMVRYAYGDWRWYAEGTTGAAEGYAALFRETPGALGRRVLPGPLTAETLREQVHVGIEDMVLLDVDAAAAQRVVDRLDGIAEAGRDRMVTNQAFDLDFFPHPVPYTRAHNSNRVLAGWLREMGAEVEGDGLIADWRLRR
ncbi:hypothetical protein [Dongia deserti]|uniref:hypothetical protein n=1 Tax=Dongia deserti TaxID=2268030 RepID=UPI000E649D47|nr:hypothetical protein [Dongia deserti]